MRVSIRSTKPYSVRFLTTNLRKTELHGILITKLDNRILVVTYYLLSCNDHIVLDV